MYAARKPFIIYVGNHGVKTLSRSIFGMMQARDSKITEKVSELQLRYVLTLAYTNRVVQTALHYGYKLDIPEASQLKRAAESIQLPGILAKYVESIGVFKLATGAEVAPFAGSYFEMFPENHAYQISPVMILTEAERTIPNDHWHIDYRWIEEWNINTTRPSRGGMGFTSVNYASYDGRLEMLVSYRSSIDPDDPLASESLVAVAPQQLSEAEGMLGGVYKFRDYDAKHSWLPGVRELLFAQFYSTEFQAESFLATLVIASLTS